MAVVFISPKQRQTTFFLGITLVFVLFLVVVSFAVFLSKPKKVAPELVFNKPKISIDTKFFDSDQFKNLQPFSEMKIQFKYSATTSEGLTETGFVAATSSDQANQILKEKGLVVINVKEAEVGRKNPFIPY